MLKSVNNFKNIPFREWKAYIKDVFIIIEHFVEIKTEGANETNKQQQFEKENLKMQKEF